MTDRSTPQPLSSGTIRVLVRLFRIAERESKASGLSLPQYRALESVCGRSRRASELSDNAVVSRPAISVLMAGLEGQGLLQREPVVRGDRRGVHVTITPKGREALARAEERMAAALGGILSDSDAVPEIVDELRQLEDALDMDLEHDLRLRANDDNPGSRSDPDSVR